MSNWVRVRSVAAMDATVFVNLGPATSLERYAEQNFTSVKFGQVHFIAVLETPEQILAKSGED
jgi:hypothetical protein